MTTTQDRFAVEATLTGVQPKAGKPDSYEEAKKANTLVLTLELKLPAPIPPKSFDKWTDSWDRDGGGQTIKRNLETELREFDEKNKGGSAKLPKVKRGTHYYQPDEIGKCVKCDRLSPDGEGCIDPKPFQDANGQAHQSALREKRVELSGRLQQEYTKYFDEQTNKMNRAFAATLGSGLFVAMLGQMVEITFRPSSTLFQPMLDATFAIQKTIEPLALAASQSENRAIHLDDSAAMDGSLFQPDDDENHGEEALDVAESNVEGEDEEE